MYLMACRDGPPANSIIISRPWFSLTCVSFLYIVELRRRKTFCARPCRRPDKQVSFLYLFIQYCHSFSLFLAFFRLISMKLIYFPSGSFQVSGRRRRRHHSLARIKAKAQTMATRGMSDCHNYKLPCYFIFLLPPAAMMRAVRRRNVEKKEKEREKET